MDIRIKEKESQLKSIINSGNLLSIDFFQVNNTYFEINKLKEWIIDGGVQLSFSSGIFTIGWSQRFEMIVFEINPFDLVYKDSNYKPIINGDIYRVKKLVGKRIHNVSCRWVPYEYFDVETSEFKEDITLEQILLEFDSGDKLLIAVIDYDLKNNDNPINYRYALAGELLITLNSEAKIFDMSNI